MKLRTISGLLRAEVIYITPAGRKLRTYGEVEKALEVMDTNLTKDNFSFSNKLQVGTFYLPCEAQVGKDMLYCIKCYKKPFNCVTTNLMNTLQIHYIHYEMCCVCNNRLLVTGQLYHYSFSTNLLSC